MGKWAYRVTHTPSYGGGESTLESDTFETLSIAAAPLLALLPGLLYAKQIMLLREAATFIDTHPELAPNEA